ncbi:MAG: GUN4 domain-containing protein [Microcystis panniformis]
MYYRKLRDLLKAGKWKEADKETVRLVIEWEEAEKEKKRYIRFNFPCAELRTIDKLWVKYSNGRFGFSVQKQIYQRYERIYRGYRGTREYDEEIWRKFGDKVGWRKGGDWLSYKDIIYKGYAPFGHLPAACQWDGMGEDSLFSRVETCSL